MEGALANRPIRDFPVPSGIVTRRICAGSGAEPDACRNPVDEFFAQDQLPQGPNHDWWRTCSSDPETLILDPFIVPDPGGQQWLEQFASRAGVPIQDCP